THPPKHGRHGRHQSRNQGVQVLQPVPDAYREHPMRLVAHPVSSDEDVEHLRRIRNACAEFMTEATDQLSPEDQANWWAVTKTKPNTIRPFLYSFKDSSEWVGYGLARIRNDVWVVTGGLLPEYRAKGLGYEVFSHLLSVTGLPCRLDVHADNIAGYKTYQRLGFKEVSRFTHKGIKIVHM